MPHNNYDAIVVGAGHNGLTNATYLARSGLKVLLLERNPWIGGAAVSREIEKGWTYSNCSYVCSLLRPEIFRDLELARHGLQVVPYGGGVTITSSGDILGSYADHELKRREFARHNAHDGDAYDRYSTEVMRQCKFIRPLLLRTPPDPTSLRPRDIRELIFLSKEFKKLGEQVIYDTIRFYSMSIADYLAEFFDSDLIKAALSGSGIIGTALGPYSPGTAYVLLHHYMPADQAIHLDRSRSPFELDLGRLVDFNKPNFNGRRALLEEQKRGSRYRFVRLEIAGNKVARAAYIYNRKSKGEVVGTVTSAEWSPSAKTNIALASLHMPWGRPGDELWADIYYQRELQWSRVTVPCRVVEGPFFDPPRRRATPAADF